MPIEVTIELDDEETWPQDLRTLLDKAFSALRAYETECRRIDSICEKDFSARCHPPSNPYERQHSSALASVNERISTAAFVGYHCTRLHEEEIEAIKQEGLRTLSVELLAERIQRRVEAGDLPKPVGERLLARNRADDSRLEERRAGLISFVFTRDILSEEAGIWRLVTYWGGEALYIYYEEDPEISPLLRHIGTACIVQAAIPVRLIETYCSCGERLLNCFLNHRGIETKYSPGMEGSVEEHIPGERIQRIIRRSDPEFERFTACGNWQELLR